MNKMSLLECIEQLEYVNFTDEYGNELKNNIAYIKLKKLALNPEKFLREGKLKRILKK